MSQPPPPPFQGPPPQPPFDGTQPAQWPQQPPQQWPQQPPQWQPEAQQQWPAQPAPQQAWQGQYAPPGPQRLPGPGIGTHLKRAIDWNVADVIVTPREAQTLSAAGIDQRLQGLFAWRRSTLLVALPLLLLSVVLAFVQSAQTDTSGLTGVGDLVVWLPTIALTLIPIGAARAVARWTELRASSKFLVICWVLSIAIPLLVALVPLDYLIDLDTARQADLANGLSNQQVDAEILSVRFALAVSYALTLLPVVITIPGGVLRGAARVKSLFPSAALPGWFLVSVAPFYSVFTIVLFVLIDQIVGNGLLLVGVGLLAFGPWLYVIYRKVYARPLSMAEAKTELARASRLGGVFQFGALFCIVIFVFTQKVGGQHILGSDDNKAFFTYLQVSRTLGEVLSRNLATTVVFSIVFMQMIYSDWSTMYRMRADIRVEHDNEMQALERYLGNPAANPGAPQAWGPDPYRPPA